MGYVCQELLPLPRLLYSHQSAAAVAAGPDLVATTRELLIEMARMRLHGIRREELAVGKRLQMRTAEAIFAVRW